VRVYTLPQSAFRMLTTRFENMVIDTGGAGDYFPKPSIQIRRVKEMVRGSKAMLRMKLPLVLLKDLVAFSVSRMNIRRSMAFNQNVCARVSFTGMKPDFSKELLLAFGNYCEVYDGMDNTTKSRSIPFIALHPCCNITGSWAFNSFLTKTRIRRMQRKKIVTSEEIIEKMNAVNPEEIAIELVGESIKPDESDQPQQNPEVEAGAENQNKLGKANGGPRDEPNKDLMELETEADKMPELINQDEEESDDEVEDDLDDEKEDETLVVRIFTG
jgi:hypothetical protein